VVERRAAIVAAEGRDEKGAIETAMLVARVVEGLKSTLAPRRPTDES
jgi:hypothetical protein